VNYLNLGVGKMNIL